MNVHNLNLNLIISPEMRSSLSILLCFVILILQAQKQTPTQYIERYKDLAVIEMHRSGVPASITLSQGVLESSSGNSRLAKYANNHFGIKCHKDWKGKIPKEDWGTIDVCVCLGGDGVILHASKMFQGPTPPVLGFHLGSLGFLTNHPGNDMAPSLLMALGRGPPIANISGAP